jgi:hypothetical protein
MAVQDKDKQEKSIPANAGVERHIKLTRKSQINLS